jgi:hypothetical protein
MIKAGALVLYKLFLVPVYKEQCTCNCMRCNLGAGPILSNVLWNYKDKNKFSFEGNTEKY